MQNTPFIGVTNGSRKGLHIVQIKGRVIIQNREINGSEKKVEKGEWRKEKGFKSSFSRFVL